MSHVLLVGNDSRTDRIRCLLNEWGVTVGRVRRESGYPSVQDCDSVILVGESEAIQGACLGTLPDGPGGAAGPAAPLIFIIGKSAQPTVLPAGSQVLSAIDDNGENLRRALAVATAAAGRERELASGCATDHSDYLHFLGHELRSPLTAIKTSLEVLADELGGLDPQREATAASLRMLDIALRNVRRLHGTVEWSQELLAAGGAVRDFAPRPISVDDLKSGVLRLGEVEVAPALGSAELRTDPDLLAMVTAQMTRVIAMVAPGQNARVAVHPDEETGERCLVKVTVAGGPTTMPERLHLVSERSSAAARRELGRMAGFMVAADLLAAMGATLVADDSGPESIGLVLSLPLGRQAQAV